MYMINILTLVNNKANAKQRHTNQIPRQQPFKEKYLLVHIRGEPPAIVWRDRILLVAKLLDSLEAYTRERCIMHAHTYIAHTTCITIQKIHYYSCVCKYTPLLKWSIME